MDTVTHIRADFLDASSYTLAPPRVHESGATIYQAVLAIPQVQRYGDELVYTPPDVLRSDAYIASIVGSAVTLDDAGQHFRGVTPETAERADVVGRVIAATWDDDQQALVGDVMVDRAAGNRAIKSGAHGVSLAYRSEEVAESGQAPDGTAYTHRQIRRWDSNNLAITVRPRGGRATHLRADSEKRAMEIADLTAAVTALTAKVDAFTARPSDAEIEADKTAAVAEATEAARADALAGSPKAGEWAAVFAAAQGRDIELSADADLSTAYAEVAASIVGKDAAKDLTADACRGVVLGAAKAKPAEVRDPNRGTVTHRADAKTGRLTFLDSE